jgi:hypothetical protein
LGQLKKVPNLKTVYERLSSTKKAKAKIKSELAPYVEPPDSSLPLGEQRKIYFERLRAAELRELEDNENGS